MSFWGRIFYRLKKRLDEQNFIDSNAIINSNVYLSGGIIEGNVTIGSNCKIYQSRIQGTVTVGQFTSIWGPGTSIIGHSNLISIGKFCSIARYVSIQESNHRIDRVSSYHFSTNILSGDQASDLTSKGSIEIGNDVWIGAHSILLSGIKIGNGAVIGAGSVVTKDVPAFSVVAGNPARVIKYRFTADIIEKLETIQWWDWSIDKIKRNRIFFESKVGIQLPTIEK